MSFADVLAGDQRLLILQLLEQDADYSHNQRVLHAGLDAMGHAVSMDAMRAQLRWLEEVGLVKVSEMEGIGMIVRITQRGVDVARGRSKVDGVARPGPGV
jgi:Fe2+ or Zn2+ uptake regulation protein